MSDTRTTPRVTPRPTPRRLAAGGRALVVWMAALLVVLQPALVHADALLAAACGDHGGDCCCAEPTEPVPARAEVAAVAPSSTHGCCTDAVDVPAAPATGSTPALPDGLAKSCECDAVPLGDADPPARQAPVGGSPGEEHAGRARAAQALEAPAPPASPQAEAALYARHETAPGTPGRVDARAARPGEWARSRGLRRSLARTGALRL